MVIKSAASATPADLIAFHKAKARAIQVKATLPTRKDYEELIQASRDAWIPWLMMWKPKGKRHWTTRMYVIGREIPLGPDEDPFAV